MDDSHVFVLLVVLCMMPVQYHAKNAKGGARLLLSAAWFLVGWFIALLLWREQLPATLWLLLCLASLVAAAFGYFRLTEPWVLLEVTADGLTYFHRKGQWRVRWTDLAFVSVPELAGKELAFIGLRLKKRDVFLSELSPRIAVALLMEQRSLLYAALRENCPSGSCPSSYLNEMTPLTENGREFTGVLAMFGHRMRSLGQLVGFDLYIPLQALAEEPHHFCRELNQLRLQNA